MTTGLRESLTKVLYGVVVLCVVWIAWYAVGYVPGLGELWIGRMPAIPFVRLVMAIFVLVFLFGILPSVREIVAYYIGLMFRLSKPEAARHYKAPLTAATTNLIGFVYLWIAYALAITPTAILLSPVMGTGVRALMVLVKLAFVVAAVVLLIRVWQQLRPVAQALTKTVADRAFEATERAAYRDCPACGVRNDVGSKFCSACGQAIPETRPDKPQQNVCPNCKEENAPGARFCSSCGQSLPQEKPNGAAELRCPKCGFENTSDALFCGSCGEAIALA